MLATAGNSEDLDVATLEEMASAITPGQIIKHPRAKEGEEHMIYFPKSYDPSKKYPVIIFLHGAGGVGNPPWVMGQGLAAVLQGPQKQQEALYEFAKRREYPANGVSLEQEERAIAEDFGFIVIFPMATPRIKYEDFPDGPHDDSLPEVVKHLNGHVENCGKGPFITRAGHWKVLRPRILELLDNTVDSLGGDASRVYLCGMSIGGKGVLELAAAQPERFAAVVAACAYFGDMNEDNGVTPPMPPDAIKALVGMPLWLWHGNKDTLVKFENSKIVVEAMREANGEAAEDLVKLSELDEVPAGTSPHDLTGELAPHHGVFEYAFRDSKIYPWLLQFKKDLA